jgi:hypothetical protein
LLSKVVHDDGLGRADAGLSRWLAGECSADLDTLTRWTTWLSETITVTVLAVLTVAITAVVWRRWREPMLVAVARPSSANPDATLRITGGPESLIAEPRQRPGLHSPATIRP